MELNSILNLVATGAVFIGVVFSLTQLRHYHLSRESDSALFLLNSHQTGEYSEGIWTVMAFPDGLTKKEIEGRAREEVRAVHLLMSTWERIGILVFHKEVAMDMVEEAYGDQIIFSWRKLKLYVSGMREEHQRETIFEWFQWLAERMKDRERSRSPVPAYIAHKDWDRN